MKTLQSKIRRRTIVITIERQLWPQPPENAKPHWCLINQIHWYVGKKKVLVTMIPEADTTKNWRGKYFDEFALRNAPNWGWILSYKLMHKEAKKALPAIFRATRFNERLIQPGSYKRHLYEIVHCPKCHKAIQYCECHPLPCPFCNEEFGWSQDWNVHLIEHHPWEMKKYR